MSRLQEEGDPFFAHDDTEDPFADPFFTGAGDSGQGKTAKGKPGEVKGRKAGKSEYERKAEERERKREERERERAEEERRRAELELLLMDGGTGAGAGTGVKGFNLKADARRAKEKRRADKRGKRQGSGEEELDGQGEGLRLGGKEEGVRGVDVEDPRFAALFTSSQFAIDPTDPRFQRTSAQQQLIAERQRRRAPGGEAAVTGDGRGRRVNVQGGRGRMGMEWRGGVGRVGRQN
ncbi:hypothetical protein CLOP_g5911 [Closterium sp. NIES-67]|nr:hypothetical protein CLOP_g5911 [Closterium sp. NIES-67]